MNDNTEWLREIEENPHKPTQKEIEQFWEDIEVDTSYKELSTDELREIFEENFTV